MIFLLSGVFKFISIRFFRGARWAVVLERVEEFKKC
jgi:hypothetical protein